MLYYVRQINEDAGKTSLKVYDVLLGSAVRDELRRDLPNGIAEARFVNALDIDPYRFRQMSDAAGTLETQMQALAEFGRLSEHPWRGFQNIEITELDETHLVSLMSSWNQTIELVLDDLRTIENRVGRVKAYTQREVDVLYQKLAAIPIAPQPFAADTYRRCSTQENRARVRWVLEQFAALIASENALEGWCDDVAAALSIGSSALDSAIATLQDMGVEHFSLSSVLDLKQESQRVSDLVANISAFCGTLTEAVGLQQVTIGSLRASVAAVELLGRLPRSLWSKRLPTILDEGHRPALESATARASALNSRRAALDVKFDLQLLPKAEELRAHGLALRSANAVTALFGSSCRAARRVFRGIARDSSQKRTRAEIANDLLGCSQYLVDADAFASSSTLCAICGPLFAGRETPFSEFLQISNWATEVRQKLASFGDPGLEIQKFLFAATPAELERLLAIREQNAFSSLISVLGISSNGAEVTWNELIQREGTRAIKIGDAADLLVAARFRPSCSNLDIAAAVRSLNTAEIATKHLSEDATGLSLVGGTVAALRDGHVATQAALTFAENIASLDLPAQFIQHFFEAEENIPVMCANANELLSKCSAMERSGASAHSLAQIDAALWCGAESFDQAPLCRLLERNQRALTHIAALRDYVSFLLAEDSACDQGIGPVLSVYSTAGEDYRHLQKAVDFVFYRSAAENILSNDPQLRRHSGATHQQLRNQFRTLDREYLELKRKELVLNLTKRSVPAGNPYGPVAQLTDLALVTRVAGQTRPRIMVRDLMNRAGDAIQALMPCWMMSPMSVAQYLDPRNLRFDLVVMDEASQVPPEEALGAIARGAKAVIVGDQMQLPPTPFFRKLSAGESRDDDAFAEETRQDSVLEAAAGRFYPARRLKWHYRSEHASLIAFSNHEFYRDDLTVFPSPFYDHPEFGVSLVQTGGVYKSGMNEIEGSAVVKSAIEFMKEHPSQSLGIVAVNAKQAEFIREQLDKEIASDADAAAYVQEWSGKLEAYFVKNLENVQGDERDAIFISTVYGRDESGSFHQRYGPINGIYGHRRLNVLFTRAKKRVTVFTSMSPEDIQDDGKAWGVGVLKRYLQYARDGIAVSAVSTGTECDSEFERWVLQVLECHGYEAVPQVGVCGYRIDIGVRHPDTPGVFLCGIECDGATYHSARSVRERDRLRQEILERHKWKLYRTWSTDWFRNPQLQTKQLLRYLDQLRSAAPQ